MGTTITTGVEVLERSVDGRDTVAPRRHPVIELGRVEARRMARSPVLIGFVGLAAFFSVMFHFELNTDLGAWYEQITGMPLVVLSSGMPIVGVLVATRSRHDGTDELFDSQPVPARLRSAAQVVAFAIVAGWTAVFVAVVWIGTRAWQGLPIGFDESSGFHREIPIGFPIPTADVAPSLPELMQGPAAVFVCGVLGLAVGRWIPTRWTIVVLVPFVFFTMILIGWGLEGDLRWFHPFVEPAQSIGWATTNADGGGVPIVQGFNVGALGWHLLYLAGASTVLIAALAGRGRRDRSTQLAMVVGLTLVVVGGIGQVSSYVPGLPS